MFKTLKAPLESLKTQTSIINYVFGFRRLGRKMAIFGPTVRPGAVVLFFRPTRRETVKSMLQIRASPLAPRACLTGQKIITGWQRGGGGGLSHSTPIFLFLSYQLSRVKEKYNETLINYINKYLITII